MERSSGEACLADERRCFAKHVFREWYGLEAASSCAGGGTEVTGISRNKKHSCLDFCRADRSSMQPSF